MRLTTLLFALLLGACTAPPAVAPVEVPRRSPEPTCAERVRDIVETAEEAERLRKTVDNVRKWNFISDWKVVDTGKCRVLVLMRSHLLFPDGSLYESLSPERPVKMDAETKVLMARVYACRLAQLKALAGREPTEAERVPDCSDPK